MASQVPSPDHPGMRVRVPAVRFILTSPLRRIRLQPVPFVAPRICEIVLAPISASNISLVWVCPGRLSPDTLALFAVGGIMRGRSGLEGVAVSLIISALILLELRRVFDCPLLRGGQSG